MIDINLYKKNQQVEFLSPDGKSKRRATIIKEIGGGATSIVYKAKLDDETLAAVKSYREIESKTRNYQNEVSALRLLSQFPDTTKPITPIFLGHSEELDDTARFVVMEFITAPSLEKRFAEGILSEKDACHLGIQLFEFIQILHENKKSYPDIKKENFRWEDSRLRVIDIGALGENPDDNMVRRDLFQAGLIFLGQCIVNMPDYDRLLFKLSGQPLEEILNADSSSLSGGIKYVFTHLFHNDYDQRYKTPQDIISDLKILYGAHVKDKKEVCATLQTQIEQAAK
jgi:serine/threonine protein kinase